MNLTTSVTFPLVSVPVIFVLCVLPIYHLFFFHDDHRQGEFSSALKPFPGTNPP